MSKSVLRYLEPERPEPDAGVPDREQRAAARRNQAACAAARLRHRAQMAICLYCALLLIMMFGSAALPIPEHPWIWIPVAGVNLLLCYRLARAASLAFPGWFRSMLCLLRSWSRRSVGRRAS